ncbi:MAG: hypothetical protein LBB58_04885 [Cellulomonadaceae bacterium]|nr:hypothetical protein [Cellulomonadaceae bacterium]
MPLALSATPVKRRYALLIVCFASALGIFAIRLIRSYSISEFGVIGNFLVGTLPNFFAATLYTSAIFNLIDNFGFLKSVGQRILLAALAAIAGLVIWEVVQLLMGYPIDIYDIVMSALGALTVAALTYYALRGDHNKSTGLMVSPGLIPRFLKSVSSSGIARRPSGN